MKKVETEMDDELRAEYDLKSLSVRRLGPGRKSFGGSVVRLEPDVAEVFPDAESVNEALLPLHFSWRALLTRRPSIFGRA